MQLTPGTGLMSPLAPIGDTELLLTGTTDSFVLFVCSNVSLLSEHFL